MCRVAGVVGDGKIGLGITTKMFSLLRNQFTQLDFWPDASENGYAFYHRVDQVNGDDANPTHITGFSMQGAFWYK